MRPVGSVVLDPEKRAWRIECEPHVMLRLKRVFAKVNRGSYSTVDLADTTENARELLWFLDRYPMTILPKGYLKDRAEQHIAKQAQIAEVLAPTYVPRSFELAIPPREYQRLAADVVLKTGVLLLADDVGLGKTVSSITMISDPRARPALVVTLTHLPRQWKAELARFAPNLLVHILRSGKPYELERKRACRGRTPDVIITNYHKLAGWAETLAGRVKSVTFDEAQELRHSDTARYGAAKHLAAKAAYVLGLTATPIYNYGGEIYNILSCLREDCLGTPEEFGREWTGGAIYDSTAKVIVKDPRSLGAYLRTSGLMLRRTRAEVGREIPPIQTVVHEIDADPDALDKVAGNAAELARIILDQGGQKGFVKMQASEQLSYLLRQATGIAKAPYVADFVRLLVESGEQVVLYGWHREVYALWRERLADLKPAMYTGSETTSQKEAAKAAFLSGEARVLLISLRAGAGLDGLQRKCRIVVFGELDWSPGVLEQCIGRVARDGQEGQVLAYYLVADSGSDPVVSDVLGLKSSQSHAIRDPDAKLIEAQTVDPDRVKRLAQAYLEQISKASGMEVDRS